MSPLLGACDVLLLLGATLRTVRLVVADDFPGTWLIRQPAQKWAAANDWKYELGTPVKDENGISADLTPVPDPGWRSKLVQGLSCPHCIGLWIAAAMVLTLALLGGPGHAPDWWRVVAGILTLNWVAAHLGVRAGDTDD